MRFLVFKFLCLLTCVTITAFLSGCKEIKGGVSVFLGLPESPHLKEAEESLKSKKPVVVAFTTEWCPHCKRYLPTFFEVKDLFQNKATFINIDVEKQEGSAVSGRFQVRGIPTTAFVRLDGSVFKVQVGGIEKEDLVQITRKLIKSKRKKRSEPVAPFPIEPQELEKPQDSESKDVKPQELIDEPVQDESVESEPQEQEEIQQEVKEENLN